MNTEPHLSYWLFSTWGPALCPARCVTCNRLSVNRAELSNAHQAIFFSFILRNFTFHLDRSAVKSGLRAFSLSKWPGQAWPLWWSARPGGGRPVVQAGPLRRTSLWSVVPGLHAIRERSLRSVPVTAAFMPHTIVSPCVSVELLRPPCHLLVGVGSVVLRSMPAPRCEAGALGGWWWQEPGFQSTRLDSLKVSLLLGSWTFLQSVLLLLKKKIVGDFYSLNTIFLLILSRGYVTSFKKYSKKEKKE